MIPLITAVLGFIAGILADWIRQWTALWFLQRHIRKAIMAELSGVVVTVNFFILRAIENIGDQHMIATRYFESPLRLESFEHYWGQQRDQLLKLPEWPRLKNWTVNLGEIGKQGHPPLFSAIMLFESLLIPPLSKCLDKTSRLVIQNTLNQPNVEDYKIGYLIRKSGINGSKNLSPPKN